MLPGFARLLGVVVLLNLLVFGLVGMVLSWNHQHERTKAILIADNYGRVLEENMARFIEKVDLTLLAVIDEIHRQEVAGGIDRAALDHFLARHDARLPEALGLRVIDSNGIVVHAVTNAGPNPRISIADREHFITPRDHPEQGLYISSPIVGRLVSAPMIILARPRLPVNGKFAGTVHVALTVESLARMFASIDIGENGSVGLWNDRLTLVARHSPLSGPTSGINTPSQALRDLVATNAPPQYYETVSGVDGLTRIFFYRKVAHWPLHLVVGVSSKDYLAGWRREANYLVGLAIVFLVASVGASLVIQRTMMELVRSRIDADEARRRSDLVLASVGDGICGIDLDGKVTFINAGARRMLGWADDFGIGQVLHEQTHHHHADGTPYLIEDCPIRQVMDHKSGSLVLRVEDEVYWRADGSNFPVEYSTAPLIERGRIVGAVNIFRDISERRAAQAMMEWNLATTEALANCLRHSLGGRSLAEVLDAALAELLDLPWLSLEARGAVFVRDGGWLTMVAQRNLPDQICQGCQRVAIGQCLCGTAATGSVVFADHVDHRHTFGFDGMDDHGHYCVPIQAEGRVLGVLNTYVAPGHRQDAKEQRFLEMFADTLAGIIMRKRAEQTLQESEALAKALMNATIDAAMLFDRDGNLLAVNESLAARFGKAPKDLIGTNFFALLPQSLADSRRQLLDQVWTSGQPQHVIDERQGRIFDNRIHPVADDRGKVRQVAVFSRDITEQRSAARAIEKAMDDLARSNAELEQFAYVASHDLRQPLRMISSYLALVERKLGPDLPADIRDFLNFAVGGAKRMDALILALLEYSRVGRGDGKLQPISLAAPLADAMENLAPAINEGQARIALPDRPAEVAGDHIELTRLFQNLIGNAIKYRSPDRAPVIDVAWEEVGDGFWQVSVADNGMGIAAEDRERAFWIFQRLVQNDTVEGTGIGLAVCRKIVQHHGGRIWIESTPGQGSTFLFTLPAATVRPPEQAG
ncbi:PAS domain-containing protein [Magnetospirillum moscoviense]|uniref:PAS domain-containing protein n=1 Tax=Magnetospirillum moscoviense TaxID=1437059 RepID=UPI001C12C84F|nr:PAS domain-containing protein [Magnetospirillum moscoviense]